MVIFHSYVSLPEGNSKLSRDTRVFSNLYHSVPPSDGSHFWLTVTSCPKKYRGVSTSVGGEKPWLFESIDCLDLHFLWLISWDPMQHLLFFTCNYCNYKLMTSINLIQYWHQSTINHLEPMFMTFVSNILGILGLPMPAMVSRCFQARGAEHHPASSRAARL